MQQKYFYIFNSPPTEGQLDLTLNQEVPECR